MLNELDLRVDGGDIKKEEGVDDWSYIDSIMEEWSKFDYRFGIRLVTYEADGSIPFATPEYVYKAGAHGYALDWNRTTAIRSFWKSSPDFWRKPDGNSTTIRV